MSPDTRDSSCLFFLNVFWHHKQVAQFPILSVILFSSYGAKRYENARICYTLGHGETSLTRRPSWCVGMRLCAS